MNWRSVQDAAPLGNIRRAHLNELGVADSTIARRVQAGLWVQLLPGLLRLTGGVPTDEELVDAALRYGGADAVVSGAAACRRHGLERAPDDGHVLLLMPHDTRRSSAGHVRIERTHRQPAPVVRLGVPLAPVERAVLDTARRLRRLDEIRALIAEAVQRGFTTAARLRAELEEGSGRGTRLVRIALREIDDGVRSAVEAWARGIAMEMAETEGFPAVEWNVAVYDSAGRFVCRPDGWIDEVALAWEIESVAYHLSPEHQERSYRRRIRMKAHDIEFIEHRPRALRAERERVKADLRLAYAHARRRPRPDLRREGSISSLEAPEGSPRAEHAERAEPEPGQLSSPRMNDSTRS